MPKLYNRNHDNCIPKSAVYIGRPSAFGNPFVIGVDGTRAKVLAKFEAWLFSQPDLVAKIREELAGKDLVCWCSPKPCHGNILMRLANPKPTMFD